MQGDSAYIRELHGNFPGGRVDLLGRVPLAAVLSEEQARRLGIAARRRVRGGSRVRRGPGAVAGAVRRGAWKATSRATSSSWARGRARARSGSSSLIGVAVDAPGDRVLSIPEGRAELAATS